MTFTNVYIGNISREINYRAFREILEEFGELVKVSLKGTYGFAEFADPDNAAEAMKEINSRRKRGYGMFLEPSSH